MRPDTEVIKHSVALRAKYRSKKHRISIHIPCMQVVPHPSDRSSYFSIPVARTQALGGRIADEGYRHWAFDHGFCVELSPAEKWTLPNRFDDHFLANTGDDPNHAVRKDWECPSIYGSISSSTLNVLHRNILGGDFWLWLR